MTFIELKIYDDSWYMENKQFKTINVQVYNDGEIYISTKRGAWHDHEWFIEKSRYRVI